MAIVRKKTAVKSVRRAEPEPTREVERGHASPVSRNDGNSSSNGGSFINLTKLFESKKNNGLLVGTCRDTDKKEALSELEGLVAEARESGLGVAFFVHLEGEWGPSLSATIGQPQQDRGSFNDGPRQNRGYGNRSYGRR